MKIPEIISDAWATREDAVILSTVDKDNVPNSIYATCVSRYKADEFAVANNYFNKTMANILASSSGSLLFITKAGVSYQLKGQLEYFSEGEVFDDMKQWNPEKLPGHGVVILKVNAVYSGGDKLV